MFILFSLSWHVVLTFIRSRLNETARPMVWWNWCPAARTVTPPVPDSCSECTICFRSACWWKNKAWVQSDISVKQSSLSLYFQMHFCSYNLLLTVWASALCTFYNNPAPLNGSMQFHYCTLVTREPEQTTLLFWSAACGVTPHGLHTADRR